MERLGPGNDELGLLTDLYELTMLQAYRHERLSAPATFSLFFRKLPPHRNFILACGQEYAAHQVTQLRFPAEQIARLARLELFQDDFLQWLEDYRFSGDIHCVPEGTPVFPHEPLLEITAPVMEAQLLESLIMNLVHVETILASKAARMVIAAQGKPVVDFGMRRMHGTDAALRGVRAYQAAGLAGTSNVLGSLRYGLAANGTMAHAYIQAHDDELAAFRAYAQLYPGTTLLVDTYDTPAAIDKVIRLVRDEGYQVGAIRLDSGDLEQQSYAARQQLDEAGLNDIKIIVSGGLDEEAIETMMKNGAPIDGFGVGTAMGSVEDAPNLDLAYKLTEYDGQPRLKNSPGKQLHPGRKQVWRQQDSAGQYVEDEITARDEQAEGTPLLQPVVRDGKACRPLPNADDARERVARALQELPRYTLSLQTPDVHYPVHFSERLEMLRKEVLGQLQDLQH